MVICSDIARAAFTAEQLAWTVEMVGKRGGGFAMVGGHTSFGSGGWDRTSWDGMIPIDMSGDGPGRHAQYYDGDFRVVVPPESAAHPIWRIDDDPARNRAILDRMPLFHGTNLTDRLKPAATLLGGSDQPLAGMGSGGAIHRQPARRGARPVRPTEPTGPPIFSCQPFGRGRSFAMSTDSTVAWGADFERSWGEGDNRYFRKFWRNVVTWLAENSMASARLLDLATDKVIYRAGQSILVTAQSFGTDLEPNGQRRLVARLISATTVSPDSSGNPPSPRVGADLPARVARLRRVDPRARRRSSPKPDWPDVPGGQGRGDSQRRGERRRAG